MNDVVQVVRCDHGILLAHPPSDKRSQHALDVQQQRRRRAAGLRQPEHQERWTEYAAKHDSAQQPGDFSPGNAQSLGSMLAVFSPQLP